MVTSKLDTTPERGRGRPTVAAVVKETEEEREGKVLRLCFLRYPESKVTVGRVITFSVTVSTDLGVYCGVEQEELPLTIQLIRAQPEPLLKPITTTTSKPHRRELVDYFKLKVLEPKATTIDTRSLTARFKMDTRRDYLEFSFSFLLEEVGKFPLEPKLELQWVVEVGVDRELPLALPGGIRYQGDYFLSLYSNPLPVLSSNKKLSTLEVVTGSHSDTETTGSRRYFKFIQPYLPTTLHRESITVVEKPFGKDLGSHSWDCAWVGLNFLSELLFNPDLALPVSPEVTALVTEFRRTLLALTSSEAIVELGSGCSLLSLGLAKLLHHYHHHLTLKKLGKPPPLINLLLSDLEEVLPSCSRNLQANVTLHPPRHHPAGLPTHPTGTPLHLTLLPLHWERPLPAFLAHLTPRIILAFDVVYNNAAHLPLTTILRSLVATNPTTPYILLGYKPRSSTVERGFFTMIRRHFQVHRIATRFHLHLLLLLPLPPSPPPSTPS